MDELYLKAMMQKAQKRLQSIKIPRDYTLMGTKTKKVYTPNLNVARNKHVKNNVEPVLNKNTQKLNNSTNKQSKSPKYVQCTGTFSGEVGPVTSKLKNEKLQMISKSSANTMKHKNENIKRDVPIYYSDDESEGDSSESKPISWDDQINQVLPTEPPEYVNKVSSDQIPIISLWTLPDILPCARKDASSKSNDVPLSELPKGHLGKLIVRKSGKVQVQLGSIQYDLDSLGASSQKEELVNIEQNAAIVLGNIHNCYLLNPVWNLLMSDIEDSKN